MLILFDVLHWDFICFNDKSVDGSAVNLSERGSTFKNLLVDVGLEIGDSHKKLSDVLAKDNDV